MPYREQIEFIPNSPYNFMPPVVWENKEWNRFVSADKCPIEDDETCLTVDQDDPVSIQFLPRMFFDNKAPASLIYNDTTTAVVSGSVHATGIGNTAQTGMLIFNASTNASTYVTGITSADEVTVSADIFQNVGDTVWLIGFKSSTGWYLALDTNGNLNICRNSLMLSSGLVYNSGLTDGAPYFVTLQVVGYMSGYANVVIGNNTMGRIDGNGTFEFYGICRGGGSDFTITTQSGNFVGCIRAETIMVYEIDVSYQFALMDTDYNIVTGFASTDISSFDENALTHGVLSWVYNTDIWSTITLGECACRYLVIAQPAVNSAPPFDTGILGMWDFRTFKGWKTNAREVEFVPGAQNLRFANAANGATATYYNQQFYYPPACGLEYTVTFTITNYFSGQLRFVGFGTEGLSAISGNGTYTVTMTETAGCDMTFSIIATGGPCLLQIDNVIVHYADDQFLPVGRSELLCICAPKPCNVKISYRNDVDSFGWAYEYEPDYRNTINICGRLRNSRIQDNEYISNKSPQGVYSAVYADVDNVEELVTDWIPNYQAQAIHVAMRHSDIMINDVPYVSKGSIEAQTNDETELVKMVIPVAKKDQSHTYMYRS